MTTYYTQTDNILTPLALPVEIDGAWKLHPTVEQAARFGAYPRNDNYTPGDPPEDKQWQRAPGWTLRDGAWCANFEAVDIPAPTLADFDNAMEDHLRAEREARGYTTREPDAYLKSSVPRWKTDADNWVAHRDEVMTYALDLINAVQSGQREPPTMEEFLAGLPRITWSFAD